MVHLAIQRCDIDVRRAMWYNVVLAGGTTMFTNYQARLMKELTHLAPSTLKLWVVAVPERKISVWIGGSILGSLSSIQSRWISAADYEEYGPNIVQSKCKICY